MQKFETNQKPIGVVVIVHGAMEHHRRYEWLAMKWNEAGFHVVMDDLEGHGLSARNRPGHIDAFNQYIKQVKKWLMEAYTYQLPVFLLGHSMGGLIAIRVLEEVDIELAGVILSSPCVGLVHRPNALLDSFSHLLNLITPRLLMNSGITPGLATRNREIIRKDHQDPLYLRKISIRWYRELVKGMRVAIEQIDEFPDVPVLVMQGGADQIVDKNKVRKWFGFCPSTDVHYKEWPNLYHEVFNEPEREVVFLYAKKFVESCLNNIGYHL